MKQFKKNLKRKSHFLQDSFNIHYSHTFQEWFPSQMSFIHLHAWFNTNIVVQEKEKKRKENIKDSAAFKKSAVHIKCIQSIRMDN